MIAKLGLSLRGGGRETRAGGRGEDGTGRAGPGVCGDPAYSKMEGRRVLFGYFSLDMKHTISAR
jgi:hypothetical protein